MVIIKLILKTEEIVERAAKTLAVSGYSMSNVIDSNEAMHKDVFAAIIKIEIEKITDSGVLNIVNPETFYINEPLIEKYGLRLMDPMIFLDVFKNKNFSIVIDVLNDIFEIRVEYVINEISTEFFIVFKFNEAGLDIHLRDREIVFTR